MLAAQESISTAVLDHLCSEIESTELCTWPYSHFYLEKAFPDDVFKRMLELLPPAPAYVADNPRIHTRDDGLVTRNILSLSAPGLERLQEPHLSFWRQIGEALFSKKLRQVVFAKLSKDLSKRFRLRPDQL